MLPKFPNWQNLDKPGIFVIVWGKWHNWPKNPRKSCTRIKPVLFIFQSCQPGETQSGMVSPLVRRGGEQFNPRPRPSATSRPPYRVSRSCEDEADTITVLERLIRTHPVWFLPDITRDEAYNLLQGKEPGVRHSRIYFIQVVFFVRVVKLFVTWIY